MKSSEIRKSFLEFFAERDHQIVDSASLVPDNDPTLLFTNAGMVPFKEALAFREDRGYKRATSCQRCIRVGGKHNDLDEVGYTERHHTFFEMLGNFSFGDYFKTEAIHFAWEFLTEVLALPVDRLWVTVHKDDHEALDIWVQEIGFDVDRISLLGDDDNFWTMGDTGPCGPSSEIFWDHGDSVPGGPPGSADGELDRFTEIWNLVFTQYDRTADGTLTPLPKPCVDTGMGFERLAAVLQGVHTNYEIDLFRDLIKRASELVGHADLTEPSLKVIADHIRSCSFLIADGVVPSNEGRGYVLRRIIRRALRHGHKLQSQGTYFHKLVDTLVDQMGDAYPILRNTQSQIERILKREEEQFEITLDQGMSILADAIDDLEGTQIPGSVVFRLYDTYGFPADLTADIARERGLTVDLPGFDEAMDAQRERARAASKFGASAASVLGETSSTGFVGYDTLGHASRVAAIYVDGSSCEEASATVDAIVVLDESPFYAESGGQVGDAGHLTGGGARFEVTDTTREAEAWLHRGTVSQGVIKVGDVLEGAVDAQRRLAIRRNHSATHLLHAALREVLGEHVNQRGSLVDARRLRFDFSHFEAVTADELRRIESIVNEQIRRNSEVQTDLMDVDAARERGAMALFGEKYSQQVRVLTMGDGFSIELCGGTHASRTGDIGLIRVIREEGIASGVRRIEAVTGVMAVERIDKREHLLASAADVMKTDVDGLLAKLNAMVSHNRKLEKEVQALNMKLASGGGENLLDEVEEIAGVKLLVRQLDGASAKTLPAALDRLKNKLQTGVVVLASVNDGKVALIAGVTQDLTGNVQAGDLINFVAVQVGGKGGGRPDMARAGGNDPQSLPAALASVAGYLTDKLA